MSYKRNAKSRIARLMLALTLMGGVGQKLVNNNVSYAVLPKTGLNVFIKQNYGVHELKLDLDDPVVDGQLTEDAKYFGRFLTCNPVLEAGNVAEDGSFKRDKVYDVQAVKNSVMNSFVSNYTKFIGTVKDKLSNTTFAAMYPAIANLAKKQLFDFKFSDFANSKSNDDTFKLLLTMFGPGFTVKVNEVEGYRDFLKEFANGITGKESTENSKSALIVNSEGARLVNVEDISSLSGDDQVIYSDAEFEDCGELANIDKETSLGIRQTLNSFIDQGKGNFAKVGDEYYLITNDAAPDKQISLLATLAAIDVYNNGGDINAAVDEYRSIAKSPLQNKDKEGLDASYKAVSELDGVSYPKDDQEGAVDFVLSVKDAYSRDINQQVNKNDFLNDFFNACKLDDLFKRIVNMISLVFVNFFDTTTIMEHPAYGRFLKYVLVGSDFNKKPGQQKCEKWNENPKGPGAPVGGNPDEKKGLSTGAKFGIGLSATVVALVATGVALWKTGYGAKLINKVKDLMNGNKNKRPDIKFNGQGNKPVVKN